MARIAGQTGRTICDHYGNAMSGLRAFMLPRDARLVVAGRLLERAETFSDQPPGTAFWYEKSNGLAKSPSIKVALTVSLISRLVVPSKSFNKRDWPQLAQ
jgi:hypothetical protein